MSAPRLVAIAVCLALAVVLAPGPAAGQSSQTVPSIELSGAIDPAQDKWISSALDDAKSDGAPFAIIRIDTPGGLETSMRDIVQSTIDAPMPVVTYVAPNGARAASAGAFITEAGDVAAMAPQTNIGSASAIQSNGQDIGGTLGVKIENDASAFIRALAQSHGRSGDLPGKMVTDAANYTSTEALDGNAIDLIAGSDDELLTKLDGFRVQGPKAQTLSTSGVTIDDRSMPFKYQLYGILTDPTVAYLLILVGLIGIAIEFLSPGGIVPGVVGVISLLLGIYGSSQLPVTAIGIVLLIVGVGLLIAEAHLSTHGIVGALGVVSLAAAGLLLFNTDSSAFGISAPVVIIVALLLGIGAAIAVSKAVAARRAPPLAGREELVGASADVRVALVPEGQVYVQGALWRARLVDGLSEAEVERGRERGARVRVEAVEGLTLRVRPLAEVPEPSPEGVAK